MRACVICGVCIEGRHSLALTCSTPCATERKRLFLAERQKQRNAEKRAAKAPLDCRECGVPVIGRGAAAKFCSSDCQSLNWKTMQRKKTAELRAVIIRRCKGCGGIVPTSRQVNALHCSPECAKRVEKRRYRGAMPNRDQEYRNRENEVRQQQRAALKLLREIEANGPEALL